MKKSIKIISCIIGIAIVVAIGTYFYRHRYDRYELTTEEQQTVILKAKKQGKTLVAYFSWPATDEVDGVTYASLINIDGKIQGNTEYVAKLFAQELGADLFRIETERTYPLTRGALIESTKEEQDNKIHPLLRNHIDNMDEYEIIFLGYPLWWYDFPMPIYSFIDEYDLAGKTIVLFTTHAGNRFCKTLRTIQELLPISPVIQGIATHEDDVADAEVQIKKWLIDNGFIKVSNESHELKCTDPTVMRIKDRGKLLVGTTGDYRPLSFREADGKYWGFGIELAEAIAKRLDVDIQFVPTTWPTLTSDVMTDPQTFDLAIGGITITDQRCQNMLMSDGYLANGKTILCRTADASRFQSIEDIDKPEVKVMVNPGGTNEKFANERLTHATLIVHQKNEEIPMLIAEGKADIMITEITEAPYYISTDQRLAAPLLSTPFTHSFIGVLMRKGQDDLQKLVNLQIMQMKADGSLRQLHEKYGLVYAFAEE